MVATNDHRVAFIASVHGELGRRRGAQASRQARIKPQPLPLDSGTNRPEQFDCLLVSANFDTDLVEDPVGVGFEAV